MVVVLTVMGFVVECVELKRIWKMREGAAMNIVIMIGLGDDGINLLL